MNEKNEIKKWYLHNFKEFEKKYNSDSFVSLRKEASVDFDSAPFPTKKDEEWKYTNVTPIFKNEYIPSPLSEEDEIEISSVDQFRIPELDVHLLVFINGKFSKQLSKIDELSNGIIIDNFYNQLINNTEFIKKHVSNKETDSNIFNHLNKAFTHDGFVIFVPKSAIVEKPIHILNIASGKSNKPLIQPRNLVVAEENSEVNIINEYIGDADLEYFTNIISEIKVDKNAKVSFYKIQNESNSAYHIDKTEIEQKESSLCNHFSLSFGSAIARNDFNVKLDGENIENHLFGLYLGNGNQHIDHHTFIHHAQPNCMSNELYKGILDDRATGVFSGKILVDKIAQKTNAFQSNKSVLLSDEASVDTKPQLEIYADDVKCSHGATVGKLNDEAFFYIRSRGVPEESARSMLIRAFVDDVISEIKIDQLQEKINHTIFEHLHREEF